MVVKRHALGRLIFAAADFEPSRADGENRIVGPRGQRQCRIGQHFEAVLARRGSLQRHSRRRVRLHSYVERAPAAETRFVLES